MFVVALDVCASVCLFVFINYIDFKNDSTPNIIHIMKKKFHLEKEKNIYLKIHFDYHKANYE